MKTQALPKSENQPLPAEQQLFLMAAQAAAVEAQTKTAIEQSAYNALGDGMMDKAIENNFAGFDKTLFSDNKTYQTALAKAAGNDLPKMPTNTTVKTPNVSTDENKTAFSEKLNTANPVITTPVKQPSRFSFFGGQKPSTAKVMSDVVNAFTQPGVSAPIALAHDLLPGIFPDFINLGASLTVPTSWTGELGSLSFHVTMDRYGDFYWGGGLSAGKTEKNLAFSATAGWMNQTTVPTQLQLEDFLSGQSYEASAGYWGGAGEQWSPKYGSATMIGFFTPQAGVDASYSKEFFHNDAADNKNRLNW